MIKGYIIDDELAPRVILKHLLKKVTTKVEIVGESSSLKDGLAAIKSQNIDVLFLDIEMPENKGLEILQWIETPVTFQIVFITAYSQYAINAFKLSAFDYLLKPLREGELNATLLRLEERHLNKRSIPSLAVLHNNMAKADNQQYLLRTHKEDYLINVNDIVSLEADGMYTNLQLKHQTITASKPLKEILADLPSFFFRTHRSYVVNLKQLQQPIQMNADGVKTKNNQSIPVSNRNKKRFIDQLKLLSAEESPKND